MNIRHLRIARPGFGWARRSMSITSRSFAPSLSLSTTPLASSANRIPIRANNGMRMMSTEQQQQQQEEERSERIEADQIIDPHRLIVEIDSIQTFQEHVNEDSPAIVIDFYADWCGPCKQLSPILENIAIDMKGRFKLLKINVDNVQDVASQFNVTVLPTLYGVVGGKQVAAMETGLHPEPQMREWVKAIIVAHDKYVAEVRGTVNQHATEGQNLDDIDTSAMSPQERLDLAARLMAGGKHEDAGKLYKEVIEDETAEAVHPKAYAGLLMCLIGRSQFDDCDTLVESLTERYPVAARTDSDLMRSLSLLDIGREFASFKGDSAAEVESQLAQQIEKDPDNIVLQNKYSIALFMIGRQDAAVTSALNSLKRNKGDQSAKDLLIKFFNVLGPQSKITVDGRRKMASYLF